MAWPPEASSPEVSGTNTWVPATIGEPVMPDERCGSSASLAQISAPVWASNALTILLRWPTTSSQPLGATVDLTGIGVVREATPSLRQWTQPVLASSA